RRGDHTQNHRHFYVGAARYSRRYIFDVASHDRVVEQLHLGTHLAVDLLSHLLFLLRGPEIHAFLDTLFTSARWGGRQSARSERLNLRQLLFVLRRVFRRQRGEHGRSRRVGSLLGVRGIRRRGHEQRSDDDDRRVLWRSLRGRWLLSRGVIFC